ncbi:MAG TPA: hypothetical protein V6D47_09755 [Oscillatoriaceae cyanobacterium]
MTRKTRLRTLLPTSCLALAGLLWCAAPAGATAIVDRPTFERGDSSVLVPYRGTMPHLTLAYASDNTVLVADFGDARARIGSVFRMGLFHPLVQRLEMTPEPGTGHVRLTIHAAGPAHLAVFPEPSRGVIRLEVVPGAADAQANVPLAPQPALMVTPGMADLPPSPPPYTPYAPPSTPPVQPGVDPNQPLPGTPDSGSYVYRTAVPAPDGKAITEVVVSSGEKAQIAVDRDPRTDNLVVNVQHHDPETTAWGVPEYHKRVWPQDPFATPIVTPGVQFKPVAAIDATAGYALMRERAPNYGSDFSGGGGTAWGFSGDLPLGDAANLALSASALGYVINSLQVPDDPIRRDEYLVRLDAEWLPIRGPWVLAIGPGYWLRDFSDREIGSDTTPATPGASGPFLPPPDPSALFVSNEIEQGPTLHARAYYPFWGSLAIAADVDAAPYLFGGGDSFASALGPLWGVDANLALKWTTRFVSVSLGYDQLMFNNQGGDYNYMRGGPEASLVWHF